MPDYTVTKTTIIHVTILITDQPDGAHAISEAIVADTSEFNTESSDVSYDCKLAP